MATIGEKVVKLDFVKGYSTQFAASLSVCLGSILGIPLSTTHCVIGGLVGVHFVTVCLAAGREAYPVGGAERTQARRDQEDQSGENGTGKSRPGEREAAPQQSKGISFEMIKKIVVWCLITIPVSLTTAYLVSAVLVAGFKE